mmetsp:Transcript_153674/g.268769  ORF Transcript_153674/g.268769 Transcript_153674/m.268769 type:complete len:281 (+) Transcript_153674:2911-3753(+)
MHREGHPHANQLLVLQLLAGGLVPEQRLQLLLRDPVVDHVVPGVPEMGPPQQPDVAVVRPLLAPVRKGPGLHHVERRLGTQVLDVAVGLHRLVEAGRPALHVAEHQEAGHTCHGRGEHHLPDQQPHGVGGVLQGLLPRRAVGLAVALAAGARRAAPPGTAAAPLAALRAAVALAHVLSAGAHLETFRCHDPQIAAFGRGLAGGGARADGVDLAVDAVGVPRGAGALRVLRGFRPALLGHRQLRGGGYARDGDEPGLPLGPVHHDQRHRAGAPPLAVGGRL